MAQHSISSSSTKTVPLNLDPAKLKSAVSNIIEFSLDYTGLE